MQRTFTLQRLFINLTVLCAVLGVIVAFPQVSVWCLLQAALYAPALAICWFLPYFSCCPRRTFRAALVGAIVFFLFCPRMMVSWSRPPSWWDLFLLDFETLTISTSAGALVFGLTALIFCRLSGRPERTPLPYRDL